MSLAGRVRGYWSWSYASDFVMESSSSNQVPAWLLLLGTLGAIIGFCWSHGDYVAASSLAAVAVAGLWGYYLGAFRIVGLWGSLLAAGWGAAHGAVWIGPHVAQAFATSPAVTRVVSFGVAGIVIAMFVSLAVRVFAWRLLKERPSLELGNRLIGFGIGGVQGVAAMLLLLNGVLMVEPQARERVKGPRQGTRDAVARAVAGRVVELANQTRRSTLAPYIVQYNPYERISHLKSLQRTVTAVSNPEKLQRAMKSSRVQQLRDRPEVRAALDSLAQDPTFRKLAESGQPIDQSSAMSLMNHPAVSKLLSQPDLVREFTSALQDANE